MAKNIGMGGDIVVGTVHYPVSQWEGTITNELQDVTDTGSAGYVVRIPGTVSGDISFTAFWGSGPATLSATFAIGTAVTLIGNLGPTGAFLTVPGYIASFTITNSAKSPIEFKCTLQSSGSMTMPT